MSMFLYRLGRASVQRRRLVLLVWIGLAVGAPLLARATGGQLDSDFRIPGAESQAAYDLLDERFPEQVGARSHLVVASEDGLDDDAATVAALRDALAGIDTIEAVDAPIPSPSGTALLIGFRATVGEATDDPDAPDVAEVYSEVEAAVDAARATGLQVEIGGDLPRFASEPETGGAEVIGVLVAVVVLILAFGSFLAMGLPIGIALFGLTTGLALVTAVAAFVDVASDAPTLASMIGIGVGIDYALFIVTRHRTHLRDGMTVAESAARANATSGQAVVFAGGTVVIAISGLALAGIPLVTSMGLAASVVVAVMVAASVTLLPALLGFAGMRLARTSLPWQRAKEVAMAERVERLERLAGIRPRSRWERWGDRIAARPWRYLLGSLAALLLMAAPVLSMRLGQTDAGTEPTSSTARRAYDLVAAEYGPGLNGPLVVVVDLATTPAGSVDALVDAARRDPGVAIVSPPTLNRVGDAAVISVIPTTAPQDGSTSALVHRLRHDLVPASGATAYVGGSTASFIDVSDRVAARLPVFVGAVVALSFLLLMVVFRSVLVPLKAALMNLLSIGAAYGVVVAVFQWGWGASLVGLEQTVPIVSFVPMMMFAILFGLSMDYEVFLLSRVREEHLAGRSNTESVVEGISSTARVITSAALIMIAVFLGFVLGDNPIIKMMGIGLATAVLVDATIVRVVLVPASMRLMGEANWWLPAWLDRILPDLDIEGDSGLPEPEMRTPHPSAASQGPADEARELELV